MNIHDRIRHLRQERGYSMRELSRITGISTPFISDMENGRSNPSLNSLAALAKGFDMTVMEVLAGVEGLGEPAAEPDWPAALLEFSQHPDFKDELTPEWLDLLRRTHLRGKYPATVRGWLEIYLVLRRVLDA